MATEEIQISQLELAQEVQGDMVFAVDTATDTKSLSVNQLKNHISQPLQANINAVDTSALHKYNISNCITEIPQDIKLELNNGTLTLKAGSKVYVPNGAGVFDTHTTSADRTYSSWSSVTSKGALVLSGSSYAFVPYPYPATSGTTPPSTGLFYNTTENKIQYYQNGSLITNGGISLPLAIVNFESGTPTSIEQVFNGFGYIGSTIFVLPNVKGLIPNGRNTDGTLKNIDGVLTNVVTASNNPGDGEYSVRIGNNYIAIGVFPYDEETNYNYNVSISPSNIRGQFNAGTITYSSGRITSLTPKTAFHAVDYNDFEKAMLKEDWVRVSTAPASPDSSKFYYIPEN